MRKTISLSVAAAVVAAIFLPSSYAFARTWRAGGSGVAPSSYGNVGLSTGLARHCVFVPDPHGVQHQVCF